MISQSLSGKPSCLRAVVGIRRVISVLISRQKSNKAYCAGTNESRKSTVHELLISRRIAQHNLIRTNMDIDVTSFGRRKMDFVWPDIRVLRTRLTKSAASNDRFPVDANQILANQNRHRLSSPTIPAAAACNFRSRVTSDRHQSEKREPAKELN